MGTQPTVPSAEGVISKPSPYSVDETIRRLEEVVRSKGLTIFARVDHRAGARQVGLDMQDEQVLIFGSPRAGTPLNGCAPPRRPRSAAQGARMARVGRPRLGQLPKQFFHRQAV